MSDPNMSSASSKYSSAGKLKSNDTKATNSQADDVKASDTKTGNTKAKDTKAVSKTSDAPKDTSSKIADSKVQTADVIRQFPSTEPGDLRSAVEAVENLRFKQEKERPEGPPRSHSIAGADMAAELNLSPTGSQGLQQGLSRSQGRLMGQQSNIHSPDSLSESISDNEPTKSVHDASDEDTLLETDDFAEVSLDGKTWVKTPVTVRSAKAGTGEQEESASSLPRIVHSTSCGQRFTVAGPTFGFTATASPVRVPERPSYSRFGGQSRTESALSRSLDIDHGGKDKK